MSDTAPQRKPALTPIQRKFNKFKREPLKFVKDSAVYSTTQQTIDYTWAKLGSFALVLLASVILVVYYTVIASPRYVSQSQFVVKQSNSNEISLAGLASFGAATPSMRDSLILKNFIESREMALELDKAVSLQSHYMRHDWDAISRLSADATMEAYVKYFQSHVTVTHDELSDILTIEIQTFDPQYSLQVAQQALMICENFINNLGAKMALEQVGFAQKEVARSYKLLKDNQAALVAFQDKHKLYSPEQQGGALMTAVNNLEGELIKEETELKSLQSFMRDDAPEVVAKSSRIKAMRSQLAEEKVKLTNHGDNGLNKLNVDFQEIRLNAELAADLYKGSLAGLEGIRAEAYRKLKHLLIIEHPAVPQEDKYPRRLYNIITWFAVLIMIYLIGRLIMTIVKEHRE